MITLKDRLSLFRALPPRMVGAEVGVYQGDFSYQMLCTPVKTLHLVDCWCHNPENHLDLLNPDNGGHETNYRNVVSRFYDQIQDGRIVVHREFSLLASMEFDAGDLDFVYLDADHRYEAVSADLRAWAANLKPGGFLCGHDYTENTMSKSMNFGVVRAVNEFCHQEGWKMIFLTQEEWPSYCLVKI